MIRRGPAVPGGLQHQPQLGADPVLADELGEAARAQRPFDRAVLGVGVALEQRILVHARSRCRSADRRSAGSVPALLRSALRHLDRA